MFLFILFATLASCQESLEPSSNTQPIFNCNCGDVTGPPSGTFHKNNTMQAQGKPGKLGPKGDLGPKGQKVSVV